MNALCGQFTVDSSLWTVHCECSVWTVHCGRFPVNALCGQFTVDGSL